MTRFTDRLERDLGQIADRATPSSTAWEAVRSRIDAQAHEPEMEIIMLSPDRNTSTPRRRPALVAAAVVGLALTAGVLLAVLGGGGDDEPVVDEPVPTLPGEPLPPTAEPLATGLLMQPGRYSTDVLGLGAAFEIPIPMQVAGQTTNFVTLGSSLDPEVRGYEPTTGVVLELMRIDGWRDPAETAADSGAPPAFDALDIDGWIAANGFELVADDAVVVAGLDARRVDVEIDPAVESTVSRSACATAWEPCVYYTVLADLSAGASRSWVSARQTQRFYVVPLGEEAPLLIRVAGPDEWFTLAEDTVITSLQLGADGPPTAGE